MNKQKTIEGWAGQLDYIDAEALEKEKRNEYNAGFYAGVHSMKKEKENYWPIIIVALMLLVGIVLLVS